MSALYEAMALHSDACVKALRHSQECDTCPELNGFLSGGYTFCERGQQIQRLMARAKQAMSDAVKAPMQREVAS